MNGIYLLIPFKGLNTSKSRLSSVLPLSERRKLSLAMLLDVITVARKSKLLDKIYIVTPDLNISGSIKDVSLIFEPPPCDLNKAVQIGMNICIKMNAKAALILPADIPFIKPEDICNIIKLSSYEKRVIVICKSKSGGTNALLMKPPGIIPPCFGNESFEKHVLASKERNIPIKIYSSPTVETDVDYPDSLLTERLTLGENTRKVVEYFLAASFI